MKKTIAIGDIHGRKNWKKIVEAHPTDRIVFLGDYCDPYYNMSNCDVLSNLLDIINLKKERKDNIILLLGNHDMHYIYDDFTVGTRYNSGIAELLKALFEDERKLFQFAYQEGNTLYTHAGVCGKWWDKYFKGKTGEGSPTIAEQLNNPTDEQLKAMFMVGYIRGGFCERGGIFWADLYETVNDPLPGIHQVVGHSQMEHIQTVSQSEDTSITYSDCLYRNEYYTHNLPKIQNRNMRKIIASEYVSKGHPDKMADQVSDAILDECLRQDPNTRAGIEVLIKDNTIVLGGEVTTNANVDYDGIAKDVIDSLHFPESHDLRRENIKVVNLIGKQSQEISSGVDQSEDVIGAGDQGFCVGFASNETDVFMPLGIYLAKKICTYVASRSDLTLGPDTKTQVIVEYDEGGNAVCLKSILVSTMHQNQLEDVREQVAAFILTNAMGAEESLFDRYIKGKADIICVNPCGAWHIGGPVSDCGVTGRKIVVDQFGGYANVGGGNLHGKDMTKVDRSAAYMARYIAKNIVAAGLAATAKVELSYMIGVPEPSSINIELTKPHVDAEKLKAWLKEHVSCTPKAIIERFEGTRPKYYNTAINGHYGVNDNDERYPWERLDLVAQLSTLRLA